MGRKCCVPNCYTNYNYTNKREQIKGSVFHFPKDDNLRWCWIQHIQSVICEYHFEEKFIIRHQSGRARLVDHAYPTKFPRWGDYYDKKISIIDSNTHSDLNKRDGYNFSTTRNPPSFINYSNNHPLFEMAYQTLWKTFNCNYEFDKKYLFEKLCNQIRKNLDLTKFFYRFLDNIIVFTLNNENKIKIEWIVEILPDFSYKVSYKGGIINIKERNDYELLPTTIQCYTHLMNLYKCLLKND